MIERDCLNDLWPDLCGLVLFGYHGDGAVSSMGIYVLGGGQRGFGRYLSIGHLEVTIFSKTTKFSIQRQNLALRAALSIKITYHRLFPSRWDPFLRPLRDHKRCEVWLPVMLARDTQAPQHEYSLQSLSRHTTRKKLN